MGSLEMGLTDEVLARRSSSWMTFPKAAGVSSDGLTPYPEHTRAAVSGLGAQGREADPAQARVVPALTRHLPPPLQRLRVSSVQSPPALLSAALGFLPSRLPDARQLDLDVENFHSNQYIDKVTLKSN